MRDVLGYTQLSLQASQELHRTESFGLSPARAVGRELDTQELNYWDSLHPGRPHCKYNPLGRQGHVHSPPAGLQIHI